MTCPDEIQTQLLTILRIGIRSIRLCCETKQYERCQVEATHIHNLPDLIEHFSPDRLKYYLEIELPEYVRGMGGRTVTDLRMAWQALERWHSKFRESS